MQNQSEGWREGPDWAMRSIYTLCARNPALDFSDLPELAGRRLAALAEEDQLSRPPRDRPGRLNELVFQQKKDKKKVDGKPFLRNGAILLEKLITSSNGKQNPIRSFSIEELKRATNNCHLKFYKGFLDRPIFCMKYVEPQTQYSVQDFCFNNIVFASKISHKNVLKFIGCCLETETPILVFEWVENYSLDDHIHRRHELNSEPLLWRHRLKIAMEIANAVAYIHFGLLRPIVFRDIKPSNILLDEHYASKLYNFSLSAPIPEGETHIKNDPLIGTVDYIAPEYFYTNECDKKYDVYSFGVVLLELFTGQKTRHLLGEDEHFTMLIDCMVNHIGDDITVGYFWATYVKKHVDNNTFNEIVDPIIAGEGSYPWKEQQLQAFIDLIFKCLNTPEERPTMIDVAKHLRQIYRSATN
ncbi:non-functional pseudokinase ZED1-like [Pistacia vera]|uniref:non-functional pseudokinase ZED1-like n=1 Tax=Pistacia vera TaxID=55513 RepID=UPI001263B4EE|nr:non-functional pseudokinase ZED1-like [Pistacia vera]